MIQQSTSPAGYRRNPGGVLWVRDQGIDELVEYFDQPERIDRWERLNRDEVSIIQEEVRRCSDPMTGFMYAARNYFWIINKNRQRVPFQLWESQELILEDILDLRARGRAQKLLIIKARQLGCSTLIEGLIAWTSMFFSGVNALVISNTPKHAAYLFSIMQYIYDQMPWWLRPMCASRKFEDGLIFDNPNPDQRRSNPGLGSRVDVGHAAQMSGVGQGFRLNAVHGSEFSDWEEKKFTDIVDADMGNALVESRDTMAILESTAKGAGTACHRMWLKQLDMGERAEWQPRFLPWFFDRTLVMVPDTSWKPAEPEKEMSDRIETEWVRCRSKVCEQFYERFFKGEDRAETTCPRCNKNTLKPYRLSAAQMCWMERKRENAERDPEAMKKLRQERCTTSLEAFQVSGTPVFGEQAMSFAMKYVRKPIAKGYIDQHAQFHGHDTKTGRCFVPNCNINHKDEEHPLEIWEFPIPGVEYQVGADPSEGNGAENDWSVAAVNLINRRTGKDRQVAMWASNTVDTIAFAIVLARLGRYYNLAQIAPESNRFDVTMYLSLTLQYPNLYSRKHIRADGITVGKLGWSTQFNTKASLCQTFRRWLSGDALELCDAMTVEEMKTFVKEIDEKNPSAAKNFHDDRLMAVMIAHYTAHELDFDETLGYIPLRIERTLENSKWAMHCEGCRHQWGANSPGDFANCPNCGSIRLQANANMDFNAVQTENPYQDLRAHALMEEAMSDNTYISSYDML